MGTLDSIVPSSPIRDLDLILLGGFTNFIVCELVEDNGFVCSCFEVCHLPLQSAPPELLGQLDSFWTSPIVLLVI